jgi:hypothetical protein
MDRKRTVHVLVLLVVVAMVFLVPSVASAQTCNPNHPETCSPGPTPTCNPYHPETCPSPTGTHTGAAFFVGDTAPSVGSDLMPIVWMALGVLGLGFVVRRIITTSSNNE